MRPLMVLGCTSDAGKSLLVTGLCRWFARQGVRVAPFKAQNMSNNARVVDGGEIGVAQWLQAAAAGVTPDVRMNPVLLKPEAETRSQVVVDGEGRRDLTETPWLERGPVLWDAMAAAYDSLAADHELIVLEGAGSPAEINLPDQVNNTMLTHADAAALLVSDIDRGGSFAHLFGTWSLVPESTRSRIAGFVLNRFRGDAALLAPGPDLLEARTGVPVAAVVPMIEHHLPTEEGGRTPGAAPPGAPVVAICRFPFGSNLDEFHLLDQVAHVVWASRPADIADADLVVLPGSKHVAADRAWLAATGLDEAVTSRSSAGGPVLGVCGGAMLLGTTVDDPSGIEGATTGLGLLPISTRLAERKTTRAATVRFSDLPAPWTALEGRRVHGYEIRHGEVTAADDREPRPFWIRGPVMGTTIHGLFEDTDVLRRWFGTAPHTSLDDTFEVLADTIDEWFDTATLFELVDPGGR